MSREHCATQNTVAPSQSAGQNQSSLLRQVPTHPGAQLTEPNVYEYPARPRETYHRPLHSLTSEPQLMAIHSSIFSCLFTKPLHPGLSCQVSPTLMNHIPFLQSLLHVQTTTAHISPASLFCTPTLLLIYSLLILSIIATPSIFLKHFISITFDIIFSLSNRPLCRL